MSHSHSLLDLERFLNAQKADYETALRELNQGQKVSHWIWYIFPQLAELGYSYRAKYYGIEGIEEARAYMNHAVLGPRYLMCIEALLKHQDRTVDEIMRSQVDAKKLQSFLTLMLAAGGGERVETALNAFYGGERCHETSRSVDQGF